jgi:hypothetical protein
MNRFRICLREGRWRIYDRKSWHDTADTLQEAHDEASRLATCCELWEPGALTRLRSLLAFDERWTW